MAHDEDVARELGVADAPAVGGGVVDKECGLADELDGRAVDRKLEAEARLVNGWSGGADRLEG